MAFILLMTILDKKPPLNWPMRGQITFEHFYLRYKSDMPYVIKNFNVQIKSMEKVYS